MTTTETETIEICGILCDVEFEHQAADNDPAHLLDEGIEVTAVFVPFGANVLKLSGCDFDQVVMDWILANRNEH